MKKQVTTTSTKTIDVCDLCERDATNGFHKHCSICGRFCCLTCARAIFQAPPRVAIDWQLNLCCECEASGAYRLDRMLSTVAVADRAIGRQLSDWKASVKGKNKT